jgi:hypothetical protein
MNGMKLRNLTILLILVILAGLMQGCVGTVEQGKPADTVYFEPKAMPFGYQGITDARAVAHNKVEVEFRPMPSGDYSYYLQVNNGEKLKLNLEDLEESPGGKYQFTINNLYVNSYYTFKISAVDNVSGAESENERIENVQTFANHTANFMGVQNVELIPGSGDRRVKVTWFNPSFQGTLEQQERDPVYYEVAFIKADDGAEKLKQYGTFPEINYRRVPEGTGYFPVDNPPTFTYIDGLEPGTTYYFRVRAIHLVWNQLYLQAGGSHILPLQNNLMTLKRDANGKLIKITTESNLAATGFNEASLSVFNVDGENAYSKASVNWPSATGAFLKYRIYYKKFTPTVPADAAYEVTYDDQMTKDWFQTHWYPDGDMLGCFIPNATRGCVEVDPTQTSRIVHDLDRYSFYQFKLAVCRSMECVLDPDDPLGRSAVISNYKFIRTEARLAPFGGINFVYHPLDANSLNRIKIDFDRPVLSKGVATDMELYCIDPVQYAAGNANPARIRIGGVNGTPGVALGDEANNIGNCKGLSYQSDDTKLSVESRHVLVTGVKDVSYGFEQSRYCFAIVPVARGGAITEELSLPYSQWVVRCINPEIQVPTIEQFKGLAQGCGINNNSMTFNWEAPTGGVFNRYRVFWQELESGQVFNFEDMRDNAVFINQFTNEVTHNHNQPKSMSDLLSSSTTSFKINNLKPGRRYAVGVLTAAYQAPVPPAVTPTIKYSEFNTGVRYCDAPLPKADFNEWTRIFAIGPKIDGRLPKPTPHAFKAESHIYEAMSADGVPYEVKMSSTGDITNDYYLLPPGNYPNDTVTNFNFSQTIDAAPNAQNLHVSNRGIVSLAWKDVSLNFAESTFTSNQDNSSASNRSNRKYGYRVYRSHDNRLSWVDVTNKSGLLHAANYTYNIRGGNTGSITEKMVFFTDYSAAYHESVDEFQYARTYWYRIVPVFDGKELSYNEVSTTPHNMVRVTLPPANMALVHRLMANRRNCLSLGKSIRDQENKIHKNYYCQYDGLGSRPNGNMWELGKTILDQGGDILVDRYELACNYTRGQKIRQYNLGVSYFDHAQRLDSTWSEQNTENQFFTGQSSSSAPFMGCAHSDRLRGNDREGYPEGTKFNNWTDEANPNHHGQDFSKVLWGDCIAHSSSYNIRPGKCVDPNALGAYSSHSYVYPGLSGVTDSPHQCNITNDPLQAHYFYDADFKEGSLHHPSRMRKFAIQGEFLSVMLQRTRTEGWWARYVSPFGPNDQPILGSQSVRLDVTSDDGQTNCLINLASIGTDGGATDTGSADFWRSRWLPLGLSNKIDKNNTKDFFQMTVNEVTQDAKLYDSHAYRAPSSQDNVDADRIRYNPTTKIGHIVATNSAYMPPINGVNKDMAARLCSTFEVKVGFSNGVDFHTSLAPFKKRLPVRQELLSMAAWPEDRADLSLNFPGDLSYTFNTISEIEQGTNLFGQAAGGNNYLGGACVSSQKTRNHPDGGNFGVNSVLGSRYPISGNSFYATGSSYNLDPNANSGRCISAYGVQDLVGNLFEVPVESMQCDWTLDKIYFGQYAGNALHRDGLGYSNQSAVYRGVSGVGNGGAWLLKEAPVEYRDFATNNLISTFTNNQLWSVPHPEGGYCSIANDDPFIYKTVDLLDDYVKIARHRDDFSGFIHPIFYAGNTLNTNLIQRTNLSFAEYTSFNWQRDGDGYFLNWGPNHLLVGLGRDNATRIRGNNLPATQAIGKFFNPIVGLPVLCGSQTPSDDEDANGAGCGLSKDNKLFTMSKNAGGDVSSQYPVHNSDIRNIGLSTWSFPDNIINSPSNDGFVQTALDANSDPNNYFISKIIVRLNADNSVHSTISETKTVAQLMAEGKTFVWTTDANWEIGRGTSLTTYPMGSFNTNYNGRYTADINQQRRSRPDVGTRCMVKINED